MFPTLRELGKYVAKYPFVPVSLAIPVHKSELDKLIAYFSQQTDFLYLDGGKHSLGNYSYFVIEPTASLKLLDGKLKITKSKQSQTQSIEPHQYLTKLLQHYQQPLIAGMPPFSGGLIGYFSYEYTKYFQNHVHFHQENPNNLQDFGLFLCSKIVVFDHDQKQLLLIENISTKNLQQNYRKAAANFEKLSTRIMAILKQGFELPKLTLTQKFSPRFSVAEYATKVHQAQEKIVSGDIFQLIMSNPQYGHLKGGLLPLLHQLIATEPNAYHFFMQQDDFSAVAASPETLVTKDHDFLASYPLAGTRKLTGNSVKDQKHIADLLSSEKELAEHNMLVDLGRNDLGQVSRFGSVKVVKHAYLEKFATIVHLASTIRSQVAPGKSLLDIFEAVFPAGTLSGAPKVRAIQIIDQLEQMKRGLYGGTFGYLSFSGQVDLAIGIRLLHKTGDLACLHTGAGIVADSSAANEYQECQNKARSVQQALQQVLNQEEKINGFIN
ncbi:MAG: chorismate-binding protein [Liquorilactobacillus nagelii]|uniref:anthranilate synthase component I family protein n=1 Tax=Liquorilactobacillus nagelii TaxID=82688 RepID=UPI0039EA800F